MLVVPGLQTKVSVCNEVAMSYTDLRPIFVFIQFASACRLLSHDLPWPFPPSLLPTQQDALSRDQSP